MGGKASWLSRRSFPLSGVKYEMRTHNLVSASPTLTFQSVCEEDFGHYQCEVKEAEKVVLTVHTALYRGDKYVH